MKTCKFCNQNKDLVKSHVIPRFFFKPLMDGEVPRSHNLKGNPKNSRRIPAGIWDDSILCQDCERLFSPYDNYAKEFFFDEFEKFSKQKEGEKGGVIEVSQYDYKNLKLFCLSLLWRCSVSKKMEFEMVNVGKKYEAQLKKMILNDDPGIFSDFPIMFTIYKEEFNEKSLIAPYRLRIKDYNAYRFFLGKFGFQVKVDQQSFPKELNEVFINTRGPLYFYVQSIYEAPEALRISSYISKNLNFFENTNSSKSKSHS